MILEYTWLLQHFDPDFFSDHTDADGPCIIPVTEDVIGSKPDIFRALSQSKGSFCFYLPAALTRYNKACIKENIILNFVRLLFLPNYLRIGGQCVFFIDPLHSSPAAFISISNDVCFEYRKQGIKILLVEMMQPEAIPRQTSCDDHYAFIDPVLNNYLSNGSDHSFEIFKENFELCQYYNKRMVVPITGYNDYKKKITLINKMEGWAAGEHPFTVQLIEMLHAAVQNKEVKALENTLLKTKLENSAHYLQLIRKESLNFLNEIESLRREIYRLTQQIINSSGQGTGLVAHSTDDPEFIRLLQDEITAERNRANETLNWYKHEYEVLPLWYKRAGLAIKVLTGKRTIKSLFKKSK